jgi:hypothetical protein
MATVSVLDDIQVSVVVAPEVMPAGAALRVIVGGKTTLTPALAVTVPPGPLAVAVYVVVSAGVTDREPLAGTVPMPLSKVTDVALEEFQLRVAVDPALTVEGSTTMLIAGRGITVTSTDAFAVPPGPVAVAV